MKSPAARLGAAAFLGLLALAPSIVAQAPAEPTADNLFDDATLHEIRLVIHSADWQKLKRNFQENWYYPCDISWQYQGQDVVARNVGIRSRGYGSRSATKPGLRVDIDYYSTAQTYLGLKSFILDNVTQDPSMIKERVTTRFFARMGEPASREAHTRLYVNNEYIGLYVIVESIDKDLLKRVFGEREPGDTENDGYLFEYNWKDGYGFSYLGSELAPYAEIFSPKTHESAPEEDLYRPIEQMVRTINESSDSEFESAVSQYIDLNHVAKHLALENFVAENDGILGFWGMNNFYFYRFERSSRHRFIVWDKDVDFVDKHFPIMQRVDANVLARRALAIGTYHDAYLNVLTEAARSAGEPLTDERQNVVDARGWLEREIQREADQIHEWALADPNKPFSSQRFEDEVTTLLEFARERGGWVQAEVTSARGAPTTARR